MMAEMKEDKSFGRNGSSCRPTQNSKLKTQNSKLGFTLVEMLVVIGIIAILSGAMLMGYSRIVKSARKAKTQELVSNAATALTQIFTTNDGVWPEDLLDRLKEANGILDEETSRVFVRFNLMGLSYNEKKAGTVGSSSFDASLVRLTGKDRCGIVDGEAEAILKKGSTASSGTAVPTGGTVQDHILHFAIDEDGDGITEAKVTGGGSKLKVRATAVVWAAGADGKVDYSTYGRNDDVYSWRPGQVKKQ